MKKKIRETFLNIRKNKYFQLSNKNKTFIAKQIKSICINKNINYLGFYYPINYEINIISVIVRLKINKIKFCLPVIEKNNKMIFKEWKAREPFSINRFGILEPNKINKIVKPQIILVPLIAFDKDKNRLGYGRGFYDRFLNKVNKKKIFCL